MSDLISRQDAIDAIEKLHIPEDMCVFEILSHIELAIGTLPSAEPEYEIVEEYLQAEKDLSYTQGKIDGVKECTRKLRAVNREMEHERTD